MNSMPIVENKPGGFKCIRRICRLCMSTESLEDVFGETNLHKLISDFLSIQVSNEDQLGHAICAICRLQIMEFHQFWSRCHEVQEVLQSMVRNLNVDVGKELSTKYNQKRLTFKEPPEVKTEPCEELYFALVTDQAACGFESRDETQSTVQSNPNGKETLHDTIDEQAENEPISMSDEINIEAVKIEHLLNDDEESLERTTVDEIAWNTEPAETTQTVQNGEKSGTDDPLQCSTCKRTYLTKSKLMIHKRHVCGPKKNICDVCGVGYPYPTQLKRHKLSKIHLSKIGRKQ